MHIQTEELTYQYPAVDSQESIALDKVSLNIDKGSWTALIGPTGSGKSTFVQHLNGLLKPASGKVYINGTDIHSRGISDAKLKRTVGLVFQYPEHQLFEANVYDEVAYGPMNMGLSGPEIHEAVTQAMAMVGLDFNAFKDRSPLELSGGEKRKVAIAGVLAMNPEIIAFDEATAGLDPLGRKRLLKEVAAMKQGGKTIVWITHNLNEVLEYADKVIVFYRGRVIAEGETAEVFRQAELMEEANLGLPQLVELEFTLRRRGLPIQKSFVNPANALNEITDLLRGRSR